MNIKKFFYSFLAVLAIEMLLTYILDASWKESPVGPFDILAGMIYPIINIPLAIILAYPERTRTIACAFLLNAIAMPLVFAIMLNIHKDVHNNHLCSDAQVFMFNYEGKQYRLMLHGKELEEYLNKVLPPNEKKETDTKNVYEIAEIEDMNNDRNKSFIEISTGNYRKTVRNEYILVQNGFSDISCARYICCKGVAGCGFDDTLEFKVRNDSLIGLFKSPIKLRRIQ